MADLRLVAGLGNPGREYARTRHNVGFVVVDALARTLGIDGEWKTKHEARQIVSRPLGVVLVEPLSYMNSSGIPTQRVAAWHKIPPERILVVVDDLELPFGKLRLRERGSSGGHNGLKSLIAHFGEDFSRLRVGIGRSVTGDAIEHVLGSFSADEDKVLSAVVDASIAGIRLWLDGQTAKAINAVNGWSLTL